MQTNHADNESRSLKLTRELSPIGGVRRSAILLTTVNKLSITQNIEQLTSEVGFKLATFVTENHTRTRVYDFSTYGQYSCAN